MADLKPISFAGAALDDLRDFPQAARREIRIKDASGAFRIIYVANIDDAVYVLHCFRKTTQKTSKRDLDLAAKRYKELKR